MSTVDYTLVVGVDDFHLRQLAVTWPTWKRHKPSLLKHPMLVFYDRDQVREEHVRAVVDHPGMTAVEWPRTPDVTYAGGDDKWSDPQRYKMLAGFVYVPAMRVSTRYWLKLDTDTVATGRDDWIDDEWFADSPAIVCQKWSFTKPPDQMLKLDEWAERSEIPAFKGTAPLRLAPEPGWSRVRHKRIISWCGFFKTSMTEAAACAAVWSCGVGQLPVPSQDGFLWYWAARCELRIKRLDFKSRGWEHWSSNGNVRAAAERAMNRGLDTTVDQEVVGGG